MRFGVIRSVCISMLSRNGIAVVFLVLLLLTPLARVLAQPPKVVDGSTNFHRVYVTGPGTESEEKSFKNDRDELKGDLEAAENQGEGSTSHTLEKPTKQQLGNTLDALKTTAEPGDEVTLYFGGHGNGGKDGGLSSPGEANDSHNEWIWLNDQNGNGKADTLDEALTDDELAQMLTGFSTSVTIGVIMDSCYGGGFTGGENDIQETDHIAVIGPSATAPIDPPGLFSWFVSTLTDDVADGGGERCADANDDGIVTAEELKNWLAGRGWSLGPPNDQNPGKIKSGKSKIIGFDGAPVALPSVTPNTFTPSQESEITLEGTEFASGSTVYIYLVYPDSMQLNLGSVPTDQYGSFITTVIIPNIPSGQYLLSAEDGEGYIDWQILTVGGVGGIAVFVDKFGLLAPYIGLTSIIVVASAATTVYVKRVKRKKEKQ